MPTIVSSPDPTPLDAALPDGVLVLEESRTLAFASATTLAALAVGFTWVLIRSWWAPTLGNWVAACCVLIIWAGAGLMTLRIVRPLRLTLDRDGFQLSNQRRVTSWDDVERFRSVHMTYDVMRRRAVYRDRGPGIVFAGWTANAPITLPLTRRLNVRMSGVAGTFPPMRGMTAKQLVALLEAWRTRFGSGTDGQA